MNFISRNRSNCLKSVSVASIFYVATMVSPLFAQGASAPEGAAEPFNDIVVTGSRIRGSTDTTSSAPVAVIGGEAVAAKGYTQIGQVLNELPANKPSRTITVAGAGSGPALSSGQALPGQSYPNLFNLGPARTLSLVNGRRMPPTSSGLGDEATDANIIPTGLLERVDIIQGGGAAVYGSGAIAGVVNYVLKDNYDGMEIEAQLRSDTGPYHEWAAKSVMGKNFASGRGNIAAEISFSGSTNIRFDDRFDQYAGTVIPNPAPGAGRNGIPASIYLQDWRLLTDVNGLVTNLPALTLPNALVLNGRQITIDSAGNISPITLGTPASTQPVFLEGGRIPTFVIARAHWCPPWND